MSPGRGEGRGTAVGTATAAYLAVAEAIRDNLGGTGHDVLSLHLHSNDLFPAPATATPARLIADSPSSTSSPTASTKPPRPDGKR